MADVDLRQLERQIAQGDPEALTRYLREQLRRCERSHEALVAPVIADPADDLPRLVMAQWFKDEGDPRGEFIEAQVTVDRGETYYSRLKLLRRVQERLLEKHEATWTGPLRLTGATFTFWRGFVREVDMDARAFLEQPEIVFRREPLERLTLRACARKHLEQMAEASWASRLRGLKLRGSFGAEGIELLAEAESLAGLTRLNLGDCDLGPDAAEALAGSSVLTNLEVLSFSGNEIGPEGAEALAGAANLASLQSLWLARTGIMEDGAEALGQSPHLGNLKTLGLNQCELEFMEERLLASPQLGSLRRVDVGWT